MKRDRKVQPNKKNRHIKVYTTPEIIDAFAKHAAEQGRSSSKHGEYLLKQDLKRTLLEQKS